MKRFIVRTWKPSAAMVLISTLPCVLLFAGSAVGGNGGRSADWTGVGAWMARIAGSALIVTALAWWVLVGRKAAGAGSGAAAGALGGFSAYFIPLVINVHESQKSMANSGLAGFAYIFWWLFLLAAALVMAGLGAVVGSILVRHGTSDYVDSHATGSEFEATDRGQVWDTAPRMGLTTLAFTIVSVVAGLIYGAFIVAVPIALLLTPLIWSLLAGGLEHPSSRRGIVAGALAGAVPHVLPLYLALTATTDPWVMLGPRIVIATLGGTVLGAFLGILLVRPPHFPSRGPDIA